MRAVIYARYSSALQRDASIEDQIHICQERIEQEGWTLHATYTVAGVDRNIGRVLDRLDELELNENTIVVYSADQGFYLGEHGWFDKRWAYEESMRMPLIIRWPGKVKAGARCEAMVQNIDYAPTLLAAAGLDPGWDVHGVSLIPLMQNGGAKPEDWRDTLYYRYIDRGHGVAAHSAIRTDKYKLLYFDEPRNEQDRGPSDGATS